MYTVCLLACSAAVVGLSAQELTFSRPTLIGSVVSAPATWHDVIEVRQLSTEHARLGRSLDFSDIPLSVRWNYGRLATQHYATLPLRTSGSISFPDRIADVPSAAAYRFDFNSSLKREQSLTSYWVRVEDIEAAFEGTREARR